MEYLLSIAVSIVLVTVVTLAWRVLNWVWLRPKRLERCLRQQGFTGRPYRLLYGDLKENSVMIKEAKSRPMSLSDDFTPRLIPFLHKVVKDYGMPISVFSFLILFICYLSHLLLLFFCISFFSGIPITCP